MARARAPWWRLGVINAAVALAYGLLGSLTLLLAQLSGLAAPVWPAAGVAVAVVLVYGWRVVPGVVVGSFATNAVALTGVDLDRSAVVLQAAAVAAGAGLQALAGRGLVRRFVPDWADLVTPRQIIRFLLLAGPVASVVSPTVGVATQLATGIIGPEQAPITWLTWWVGDSIGVIVFAPLTLMLMPRLADTWEGRRWQIAVPSLLIVLAYSLAILQNAALEEDRAQLQLERVAVEASGDLRRNLDRHTEALQAIKGLIVASDEVSVDEFDRFTQTTLERFPDLQALSWNPVVGREDLAAFTAAQRQQPGLEDFTVTERDADGELQPVGDRAEYVVVGYIAPLEDNRSALGFDIGSNPARQQAIGQARDTGLAAATAPIDLVQGDGTQKGMLALLPVFRAGVDPGSPEARRQALRGFAVGVYQLEDLLADTFSGPNWDAYEIGLIDVTDAVGGEGAVEIADLPAREAGPVDLAAGATTRITAPFDAYGRDWELAVTATGTAAAALSTGTTPSLLLAGLVLIFLLEAFVILLTGLERSARRDAENSSYEASHDPLTGLLNRRALLRALDRVSRRGPDEHADMLLFLDLDGFKAVNDTGGHEAGDEMLIGLAKRMRDHVRTGDAVARMGGDEFAVILMDCPPDRGLRIAEDIVRAVEEFAVHVDGAALRVGVSVGAVEIQPGSSVPADELLRRADAACYAAKRDGRGGVRAAVAVTP